MFPKPQGRLRMDGGSAVPGTAWNCICMLLHGLKLLSQSAQMHPLSPVLRPFTWKLKGRKLAVWPGEKQEAKLQDHCMWTYRSSFFLWLSRVWSGKHLQCFTALQAPTVHPPKGEWSPNSAAVLWQMAKIGTPLDVSHWCVLLLSAAAAYIRNINKSEVSCKFSMPGPVLVSGQGCRQGGKWERLLLCPSTWIRYYLPFWVGASSPTMAEPGQLSQSLNPKTTIALNYHWFPKFFWFFLKLALFPPFC